MGCRTDGLRKFTAAAKAGLVAINLECVKMQGLKLFSYSPSVSEPVGRPEITAVEQIALVGSPVLCLAPPKLLVDGHIALGVVESGLGLGSRS